MTGLLNNEPENMIWKNHFLDFRPPYFPLWVSCSILVKMGPNQLGLATPVLDYNVGRVK